MPVILRVNTPMTLPEKKKRRGRDQNLLLQCRPQAANLYEYDALMGITRVGTKEAERFEEDLDSTEYHDATEEPTSERRN